MQTNYQYDDQYRLTKMTDAKKSGSERKAYRYTYTGYDGFGRTAWTAEVSQEAEPTDAQIAKHKISYRYDTEDKITEVTYALAEDGRVESLHYAYDKNQYLIAIKAKIKGNEEEKLIRKYRYNERGKLFTIVDFTDYRDKNESYVARFYEYDALDRVSSMTYKSGTTVLEAYTYSYDKNNNIIKKTEKNSTAKEEKDHTDQTTEYMYNALGRLTKSVVTDHKKNEEKTTMTYSYDSAGNRTKKVKGEEETAYTYNGLNQLLKAKTTKGNTVKNDISYEYDVNGNQIKETDKETGDSVENTYDVENRLSTATVTKKSGTSGNETVSLTQENLYNGDGQRIQKKEAGEVTNYFYEDSMVSYTTGADTGEKLIQNLSGLEDNVIYAEQKVTGKDGTASAYQDFLYTKDIQGSTSSILNKDTKGELSYEYDDFGETSIHGSSALKNEICYTGGIYDESTGLYYLNARYYDPKNGRFLTEDTYRGEVNDPDTLHLYAYCKNNPINYVDPSGHKWRLFNEIKKMTSEKAKECMERYKSNKKKMEKKKYPVKRGYLYGQYNYSNIEFRETNISDAGCGIVAAHNAMYTCGKKELFVKLVAEYDFNMKSSGRDGIKWSTVASSIKQHGFKSKGYGDQNDFEKKITSTKPGILEAYYRTGGGHFAMIRKVGKKFHCYNLTGYSLSYTKKDDFDSVEDILRRITAHFKKGYIISK